MTYDVARVRGLFPSLGDGWIHLDPQAGMQIPDSVASTVSKAFRALVSAPGGVYPAARQAAAVVDAARLAVADLVGGDPRGVVLGSSRAALFNSLAEALNTAVWLGSEVVVTRLDDEANIAPWVRAADRFGARVRWAEIDIENGQLPSWQFAELVGTSTSLVSMTMASSTLGTMPDVGAVATAIHAVNGLLVVDATNAAPYMPLDITALQADAVVVSAERWGGPQTAAMVFRNPETINGLRSLSVEPGARGPERLEPEAHQRSMLAGLVASVEHLASLDEAATGTRRQRLVASMTSLSEYLQRLNRYLLNSLWQLSSVTVIGTGERRIPAVSFTVAGVSADKVVRRLADNGICALADIRSRALEAIGVPDVGGAVTIGLGPYSTPYDVDQLVRALGSLG
ncbi:cysteine desulfurase-like protein [Williamsia sterculiae]|uniref:Cysteine desulfurase family protein, VC1184 subfamily n=1 Tax=Williamsia sterculiae TaxID=1344003 RepID=A0A1N7HBV1_9NOCA|nr:cysteine desulfurase-like protein [Williamsia sterculiae]SIS22170.1 cysteine desulfurase family protein, VC1184 subfamily [Williamsia sterculiae]